MPTRIKKMVIRISRQHPTRFEIIDNRGNRIVDNNNCKTDNTSDNDKSDYVRAYDDGSTYYPATVTPNWNSSVANDSSDNLNNDNVYTIINPSGTDHHGPIAGVATNNDYNLTDNFTPKTATLDAEAETNY